MTQEQDPTPDTPVTLGDRMVYLRRFLMGDPATDLQMLDASVRGLLQAFNKEWGSGSGLTPYNMLEQVSINTLNIASSIDSLTSAVTGLVPLLEEIRDCACAGNGGGGEGPPVNSCPSEFNPSLPCGQVTGWIEGPTFTGPTGQQYIVFWPFWGDGPDVEGSEPGAFYHIRYTSPDPFFLYSAVFAQSNSSGTVIIRWDWTGNTIQPVRFTSNVSSTAEPPTYSPPIIAQRDDPNYGDMVRGAHDVLLSSPGVDSEIWQFYFVFEADAQGNYPSANQLGLNVWAGTDASFEPQ